MTRDKNKNNILSEAIADAKAVHEMAVANARLTLEEMFKPQLRTILSKTLRNEVSDINEDNDASSEIGSNGLSVDDPAPKEPSKASSSSSHIVNPGQEVEPMGEGVEADYDDVLNPDAETELPPEKTSAEVPVEVPGGAPEASFAGSEGEEDQGDELDLDAIIRELELDVRGDEMPAAGQVDAPVEETFQDAQAGKKVNGPLDGALKEKSLEEDAEGVFSDGKSPADVDGVPGGKKVSQGQEVTGTKEETMSEDVDLHEILREIEAQDDDKESDSIAAENVELKTSLREALDVVKQLHTKLLEVNMLNAKLLYTNKLFRGFDLNTGQKVRVVETIDRASTLREVKLIYTTLAESFNGKVGAANKKSAKAITEGMGSKPMGSTKPKSQQVLTEGDDDEGVRRLQKLAGINR